MAEKNSLSPLGRKIFLDRYAVKDVRKKTLAVGDLVVAVSNSATGQREIGKVTAINGDEVKVLLDDGREISTKKEGVDKPLETEPSQMHRRVAAGIAKQEKPAVRDKWEKEFSWLLDDWKFVPGGRILTGAGVHRHHLRRYGPEPDVFQLLCRSVPQGFQKRYHEEPRLHDRDHEPRRRSGYEPFFPQGKICLCEGCERTFFRCRILGRSVQLRHRPDRAGGIAPRSPDADPGHLASGHHGLHKRQA